MHEGAPGGCNGEGGGELAGAPVRKAWQDRFPMDGVFQAVGVPSGSECFSTLVL